MSDLVTRLLARRAAEGDAVAAVGLLREYVRSGLVSQERVDLAARLGDETALVCAEVASPLLNWSDHKCRLEALRVVGGLACDWVEVAPQVVVGLACDWAEAVLPVWVEAYSDDPRPSRAIQATRAWIAAPTIDTADAAGYAAKNAGEAARYASGFQWEATWAAKVAMEAAYAARYFAKSRICAVSCAAHWAIRAAGDTAATRQRNDVIRALLTPKEPT